MEVEQAERSDQDFTPASGVVVFHKLRHHLARVEQMDGVSLPSPLPNQPPPRLPGWSWGSDCPTPSGLQNATTRLGWVVLVKKHLHERFRLPEHVVSPGAITEPGVEFVDIRAAVFKRALTDTQDVEYSPERLTNPSAPP